MNSQYYWAKLAEELGCATTAIPYPELTAERLAKAISTILTNPRFHKMAAESFPHSSWRRAAAMSKV